jgi:5-methylcytosine-specific restriction endonuclease McrA
VQTVEVRGEFSDIRELFVRINSTGKRLTGAERRHAKFFHSELLQLAERLARQFEPYLRENGVLSPGQVGRMKHVELVCELLASLASGGPINKKTELDRIIAGKPLDGRSAGRVRDDFCCTMRIVRRVFPNIRSTRFAHAVDFYSIFLFLWDLQKKGCILTDKSRNGQAERLLTWLSQGVESVREHLRKVEGPAPEQSLFRDYLLTIKGDTDSEATRRRRGEILDQILGGVFEKKDSQRNFTLAQRRLIWNSDDEKCCRACGAPLTWDNFTIDHVKPHALGGKTELSNAALMCGPCNSKKGKGRLVGRTRAAASAAVRKAWETRRRSRGRTASTAR